MLDGVLAGADDAGELDDEASEDVLASFGVDDPDSLAVVVDARLSVL